MDKFDKLCKHFHEVTEVAADSEDATKALHEILHEFNSNLPSMDATTNNVKRSSNDDSNPNKASEIRSPLQVKRKGRPPSKRKISIVEKVVKRARKRTKQSDDNETTKEGNMERLGNQIEANICVESSIEVVAGRDLSDASTVVRVHCKIVLNV